MQIHEMRLRDRPFDAIRNGDKTVEIRLLDEKRRAIQIGDWIVFSRMDNSDDKVQTQVVDLKTAPSFFELFNIVDPVAAGWSVGTNPERAAMDMGEYYSAEEQAKYGAVAIKIIKI